MRAFLFCLCLAAAPAWAAEKPSATELIELARANPGGALRDAITTAFSSDALTAGTAWAARAGNLFVAIESGPEPVLFIDNARGPEMQRVNGTAIWYAFTTELAVSRLHSFNYEINGARTGGSHDVPALGPLSYLETGVPSGKLYGPIAHTSKIYDGMKSEYWVYVPAQYDAKTPAALMVFQDGSGYLRRDGYNPALNVIDNLIARKVIPVMICVFTNPGDISGSPGSPTYEFVKAHSERWGRTLKDAMRSTLYDTVSDRYAHFLRDEILADVGAQYNIRKDAYSRGITGLSSGAICAFNAAWQMPDQFSRVISWIGSYESIQWKEDPKNPDGGQDFPDKILRERKRNLRVWLQDGANDLENPNWGDWPLANLRMANALKSREYDFHLSFGEGTHNTAHGAAEFPEEMTWLWRGYDASKTGQDYEIDPVEKAAPPFRVGIVNRGK